MISVSANYYPEIHVNILLNLIFSILDIRNRSYKGFGFVMPVDNNETGVNILHTCEAD